MPSIALLLALVPLVFVLDTVPKEEALELISEDSLPDGVTKEDALDAALTHLVPLRDSLTEKTVTELRRMVKEDFGISGHSKSKEATLVELLLTLDLEERQRLATLTEEEAEKTAEARAIVKAASDEEKARQAAEASSDTPTPAAPKPPKKKRKPKMEDIRPRDVELVEVLVQFDVPTMVTKGKKKTPSSAPIAKSLYRGPMAEHVFKIAKARDKKHPGFLKEHVKIIAMKADD